MIQFKNVLFFSILVLAGCVGKKADVVGETQRNPALSSADVKLVYLTYDTQGKLYRDEINASRWLGEQHGFSAGGRGEYLTKFYFANTRGLSLKNIRHAVCFEGSAQEVQTLFFNQADPRSAIHNLVGGHANVKASQDGKMLGISFEHVKKGRYHFRMTNCEFGKSGFSDNVKQISSLRGSAQKVTMQSLPMGSKRSIAGEASNQSGFHIDDKCAESAGLPKFQLRADYENAFNKNEDRPWQGMDLGNEKERVRFAVMVQKYFYENMANQNIKNPDMNFIAEKNKDRYWCHTPWMHVGISGREAVHGLTKELDLSPSKKNPVYANATPGSDWGVAYFNAPGCRTLQKVFGSSTKPFSEPDFKNVVFEQGTVIVKILFTTANFPEIKDAYKWRANASEPGSVERSIKDLRHIQMDITIKDASLKGSNALLGNNVMTGYYYDPGYSYEKDLQPVLGEENLLKQIPNLPSALLKMRPMGVQVGFDSPETGDTVIFPGAYANGSGGRMNGPADNPRTSCLGCHGAAGTGQRMVPGFLSFKMFEPFKDIPALDFNQQLAVAKGNYETTP